jgi:putative DNA primase/helicase
MTTAQADGKRGAPATAWRAWSARADELAAWADRLLVVRRDVWGGYYRVLDAAGQWATCQTTHPRKEDRGRRLLSLDDLARHFRAASTRDVIGLHTTSPDNLSRWGAVDIDNHGDQSPDPAKNLAAALAWYARLKGLGFAPVLSDSNGRGGFHLRVIFRDPVPTPRTFALMRWLVRDYASHGLTSAPETFPKQPEIEPGRFGNWLRLLGRHHSRPHWSVIWSGDGWLDGAEAVSFLLAVAGDSPALIPAEAQAHEAPKVRVNVRFVPAHPPRRGAGLERRVRGYMARLPNLSEGQGRDNIAYGFACWLVRDLGLSDDAALPWLEEWDRGNAPPKGTQRLLEIMASARRYGRHAITCATGGYAS